MTGYDVATYGQVVIIGRQLSVKDDLYVHCFLYAIR